MKIPGDLSATDQLLTGFNILTEPHFKNRKLTFNVLNQMFGFQYVQLNPHQMDFLCLLDWQHAIVL